VPKDVVLTARVPEDVKESLSELAESTDRPVAWHVNQALSTYVDLNKWQIEAIKEGLAQARAGKVIPIDQIERWVASWGTPGELPKPGSRPKRKR
jgi:RHH-type rel operon transcriptional repressor/antitoxin RelB